MNSKMTTNSQLSTVGPEIQKQKQTKQTTRTGTEMEITGKVISGGVEGVERVKSTENK